MSVDEIMRTWPATISVFLKNHMQCVGCPLATFHTAVDAAKEHDMRLSQLLDDLDRAIDEAEDG